MTTVTPRTHIIFEKTTSGGHTVYLCLPREDAQIDQAESQEIVDFMSEINEALARGMRKGIAHERRANFHLVMPTDSGGSSDG